MGTLWKCVGNPPDNADVLSAHLNEDIASVVAHQHRNLIADFTLYISA